MHDASVDGMSLYSRLFAVYGSKRHRSGPKGDGRGPGLGAVADSGLGGVIPFQLEWLEQSYVRRFDGYNTDTLECGLSQHVTGL